MSRKVVKPKSDWDDYPDPYIAGTGTYQLYRENVKKVKKMAPIGFVRPKKKK